MSKKQQRSTSNQPVDMDQSIHIDGDLKDNVGVVIGHKSKSSVHFNSENTGVEKQTTHLNNRNFIFTRISALVIGVFGILAAITLFLRLISNLDPVTILLLVLSAIIAVLGVIGTLKPESVYQLFKGIIDRR